MKLDEIQKLLDEATPGDWYVKDDKRRYMVVGNTSWHTHVHAEDARLIAAAPTLIRKLLKVACVAKETTEVMECDLPEGAFANLMNALKELEAE